MASLAFNALLDRYKQILKSYANPTDYRDHVLRVQESYADHVCTAAELDAAYATPISLVAAPGSGLVNIVTRIFAKVNSTGYTAFEAGSGTLDFCYTNGSGAKVITSLTNAVLESATDILQMAPAILCVPVVNAAIVVAPSADITAGTGNIQVRVFYKTVKVSEIV